MIREGPTGSRAAILPRAPVRRGWPTRCSVELASAGRSETQAKTPLPAPPEGRENLPTTLGRRPNLALRTVLPPAKANRAPSFGVRSETGQSLSIRIHRLSQRWLGLAAA